MSADRRYDENEVRQILDLALTEQHGHAPSFSARDGLTLLQLQDVGREVGVPTDRITQAVEAFEARGESVPPGTTLGVPTSVGRIVRLPRNLSEQEWELLVGELRTTFGGTGEMASHGGLREWSHGRLQAFIEPTVAGHRLRVTDSNAAVGGMIMGGVITVLALLVLATVLGSGNAELGSVRFVAPSLFAVLGGGLIAGSALSLRRWIRIQESRMERLGKNAVSLLARNTSAEDQSDAPMPRGMQRVDMETED